MSPIRDATQTDDDGAPTPTRLVFDTVKPATPSLNLDVPTTSPLAVTAPPPTKSGLSSDMKLVLAMICVVVLLTASCILFLLWHRRRRAARKTSKAKAQAPPVPEKDVASYDSSVASRGRSSKVVNMAAFTTPLQTMEREPTLPSIQERTSVVRAAPSSPDIAAMHYAPASLKSRNDSMQITSIAASSSPNTTDAEDDSPIDGSSPFRLKRGDTIKRHSLGADLIRLWPTPPTSTYMKPMRLHEDMQVPPLVIRPRRSTMRNETSRFSDWSPK